MMLIGKKIRMEQFFEEDGRATAATIIEVGPCFVVQIKKEETDGYNAVQLGYEQLEQKRARKPQIGHAKKAGLPPLRYLREFRTPSVSQFQLGQRLGVELFKVGERLDITGLSKGKGFCGVMKRWGFAGGPAAHGSMHHRGPGSIGPSTDPGRVWKGKKMAGRGGRKKVTMKGLRILKVEEDKNLLWVKGCVPGARGSLLLLKKQR
jgi:large subunit ribosomal protein L3